jgi:anti-anti-sigma factor
VVMVFVFAIFATLSALDFKMMGVGLAVAVLIDATLIRAVLLPASMKLLGDWNWYFPARLEWLPEVSLETATTKPATATPEAGFGIGVERRGSRVRVEVTGELDLASAKLLHERLEHVENENPELLVLDLRRLGFMDSSGLREIIGAVQRGREEGRKVALVRAHGPIEDLLQLTHVDEVSATVEDPAAVGFPDEADRG